MKIARLFKDSKTVRSLFHWAFNQNAKIISYISIHGKDAQLDNLQKSAVGCKTMIITVAFNHPGLISKQIEWVKKYIKDDDYQHVVIDNSPDKQKRLEIKAICDANEIMYVPVPMYIERCCIHKLFYGGISHAGALNWMFYHVLNLIQPQFFVLLDHDIFPLCECNLSETIGDRDFYGVPRIKDHGWYLWPGWSMFRYSFLTDKKPDFMPVYIQETYLDAGGSVYYSVFSHYDYKKVDFPTVKTQRIKQTKGLTRYNDIYHSDCIQIIDDKWIHLINGSNCANIPGKEEIVDKLLENLHIFQPQ